MKSTKRTVVEVSIKDPVIKTMSRKRISYVSAGCKYYFNAQHYLLTLNRGERALYDFLCEHMDSGNLVTVDSDLKEGFGEFINRVTSAKNDYQPASAAKYINTLLETGLLLKTTRNTLYVVNPKYAFAGSEPRRQQVLKNLIEHRISQGLSIEALIDVPVEQFFKAGNT